LTPIAPIIAGNRNLKDVLLFIRFYTKGGGGFLPPQEVTSGEIRRLEQKSNKNRSHFDFMNNLMNFIQQRNRDLPDLPKNLHDVQKIKKF
jgi:hypothetical protein